MRMHDVRRRSEANEAGEAGAARFGKIQII
jgi:hypothetical protein